MECDDGPCIVQVEWEREEEQQQRQQQKMVVVVVDEATEW